MAEQLSKGRIDSGENKAPEAAIPAAEMRGIRKAFGSVQAVAHADITLYPGEIHALVGGNGSGKSTLISVLSGAHQPDGGEIYIGGVKTVITKPKTALQLGIETIYQNLNLFEMMSVTANLFAGKELMKPPPFSWFHMIDHKLMRKRAIQEFERLKILMPDVDARVLRMSGGQRQAIACARAMMGKPPKVLIMDEPTAALGVKEAAEVYRLMKLCRDEGSAILLISHNMVEVMEMSSRITVMRLGDTIAHLRTVDTDGREIVGLITGAIEPEEIADKMIS
jgi:ABC-type sugar transport system ATPase subunit